MCAYFISRIFRKDSIGGRVKMKNFKTPVSRLAHIFKNSRDQWKQRTTEKQKRIKSLEVKLRDVSESRDKWKQKAKELEQALQQIKKEQNAEQNKKGEESSETTNNDIACQQVPIVDGLALLPPDRHMYPLYIIRIAIQLFTYCLSSLRGSEKTFEIFSQLFAIPTPSFDSIRKWVLRLGLYELQREHEFRSDWIFILDHTIELGQIKCLLILGIPRARLQETGYALKHHDVEVLDIEIMEHSTGEMIKQKLVSLSERVGTPVQILSDHGPDLKKGITHYLKDHSETVYTYDVTHKMASLLKKELEKDEHFNTFVKYITSALKQMQQTELYFLAPRKQRVKARYLNIDIYVIWAMKILAYQEQDDFSQISATFTLDKQALCELKNILDSETLSKLSTLVEKKYIDEQAITNEVTKCIGKEVFEDSEATILQLANVGRKRFLEKLGWLSDYKEDIKIWFGIVQLIHLVEKQVKSEGLSKESRQQYEKNSKEIIVSNNRVKNFKEQVVEYLSEEGARIPDGQCLIGTSDIIESTFGKYKNFSAKSPLKEVGKMILTIPVFIGKKTTDFIKTAMETIQSSTVEEWAKRVFGQSNLSKRSALLNPRIQL